MVAGCSLVADKTQDVTLAANRLAMVVALAAVACSVDCLLAVLATRVVIRAATLVVLLQHQHLSATIVVATLDALSCSAEAADAVLPILVAADVTQEVAAVDF